MGAIQFIENMDRTTLTISDEEFEANVEASVSAIAEKHLSEYPYPPPSQSEKPESLQPLRPGEPSSSSARASLDVDGALRPSTPRRSMSSNEGGDSAESSAGDEKAAISGLLLSIQKPLSSISRIFSEEPSSSGADADPGVANPARTPQPERGGRGGGGGRGDGADDDGERPARKFLSAEEAAARQASAETAEAQRLHQADHANIVETLAGMFPDLDREIISDVVYQKEGR